MPTSEVGKTTWRLQDSFNLWFLDEVDQFHDRPSPSSENLVASGTQISLHHEGLPAHSKFGVQPAKASDQLHLHHETHVHPL